MPSSLTCAFEQAVRIVDQRAVAEFEGDVRLVREEAAKLHTRREQDASVFHFFSAGLELLVDELAHRDHNVVLLGAQ